ncbi:class I SAM-dependent methyltransferase [Spirulina subsalsa FACHB-351]|uniref:Class I SAM-dependent methyltransferase n=1 Tax=Spirulina subsalsa FACHB-351 TaxID=234711 RepID=A0ABT3LB02_9CYAN|nr:class I SAM-dependent methyltransferase [Spirulina subsalsa]MCW6038691.1 class I SAM-dependent methyltransferase [Spirulina subsalsa FACHB-351]
MDSLQKMLRNQQDILAMQYLAPLSGEYLPWSGYAMRPSGLVQVVNEIVINQRSKIVECGAGVSTLYIARLLRQKGGHLYTIEHNLDWMNWIQGELEREELSHLVTLIYAPLQATDLSLENTLWYDTEILNATRSSLQGIDLLLVDGPPAYEESIQYSRYPAVPYFLPQFARDVTVVLDDANREGEKEILKRWKGLLKVGFEQKEGYIAIARLRTD